MDKGVIGLLIIAGMIILQGVAWYFNKDGAITGLIGLVIGGIAGSLFGFTKGLIQGKKQQD